MNNRQKKLLNSARKLAAVLDDKFSFLGIKFGLDPMLDWIPGLGDVAANIIGIYIVWVGKELGLPAKLIQRMVMNVIIDFLIGLVPVLGELTTIFYRSNRMNMKIIESYLHKIEDENVEEGEVVENGRRLG